MRKTVTVLCALLFLTGMVFAADGGKDRLSVFPEAQNTAPQSILSGWTQVPLELSTTNYVSLDYLPSGDIWILGYSASGTNTENYGYRSTDFGANWARFTATPLQATRPGICNIAVRDANTALIGYFTGEILRTTNAGVKWDTVYSYGDKSQYINGIKFVGQDVVIAVGDADSAGCMIARSTDAGATWARVMGLPTDADSVTTAFYWNGYATLGQCMDVVGSTVWTTWYYGSSQQPLIMKSTDAGLTWTKWRAGLASLATNYYFRSINFADENLAYASTRGDGTADTYVYYKSTDGGVTWVKQPEMETGLPHAQQRVYSVKPIRGTNDVVGVGYSTVAGAKTWWSTDNGTTFVPRYAWGSSSLINSAFLTATDGYVVGGKNVLKYAADNPVKFQVNMRVKILEGSFNPATDVVEAKGDWNGWSDADTLVRQAAPSDSIYAKIIMFASTGAQNFKYWASPAALGWEADPNRTYAVVEGGGAVTLDYFNRDAIVSLPQSVTFQVNMTVKILEQTFNKATEAVTIRGSFNDWGNSTNNPDTLKPLSAPNDSIYAITKTLMSGDTVYYKFWATHLDYESIANRKWGVKVGAQTVPASYFNYDTIVNSPISTNIFWSTNMRAMIQLGWFNPAIDQMQVRGDFEGWGGTAIDPDLLNPEVYGKVLPYTGSVGDTKSYKFYMKLDSLAAVARYGPDYGATPTAKDGWNYEHPAERGDGNNAYDVINAPQQTANQMFYAGINPDGLLMTNDSVNVTFTVNMGPAKLYSDPFVPATDTVKIHFRDNLWRYNEIINVGSFPERMNMAPAAGGGDSIYTLTVKVKGKTHYNIMYTYIYYHPGGVNIEQGGGLGGQNLFITRFIRTAVPGTWPASYSFPQDKWQHDAPLPGELVQFTMGIPQQGVTKPLVYALDQNYPNPFNPSTQIRYSLPEAAKVTLKVYNLLGQEVAALVNEVKPAGSYITLFEAHNLATGVYFYRLEAGKFSQVKKMLLMK